jgi:uncharacterized protein (TIGR02996 family)
VDHPFLPDIIAHPEDDTPRLVCADWLDEHGQPERAEFIRIQVELSKLPEGDPRRPTLELRELELTSAHGDRWQAELPKLKGVRWGGFERGFVASAGLSGAKAFADQGAALFAAAPVRSVGFRSASRKTIRFVAGSPFLARLTGLNLRCENIGDEGLRALLESTHLGTLTDLDVCKTGLGDRGARLLADCPRLRSLRSLNVESNGFSPRGLVELLSSPHLMGVTDFRLAYCWLEDALDELFGAGGVWRFPKLDLGLTRLDDDGIRRLVSLPRVSILTDLNLGSIRLLTIEGVRAVAGSPNLGGLKNLGLGSNKIGDAGLAALASSPGLAGLEGLNLYGCDVGDEGMRALAESKSIRLVRLNLQRNKLGPAGARLLASSPNMSRLEELDLGHNPIETGGARALADSPHLANLRKLNVQDGAIGDAGAEALAKSPHLRHLRDLGVADNGIGPEGGTALATSPILEHLERFHLSINPMGKDVGMLLATSPYLKRIRFMLGMYCDIRGKARTALKERFGTRVSL